MALSGFTFGSAFPVLGSTTHLRASENAPGNCIVCWDDLVTHTTPQRALTLDCTHEVDVCLACVAGSVDCQLDIKAPKEITCFVCDAEVQSSDVQLLASERVIARYDLHGKL